MDGTEQQTVFTPAPPSDGCQPDPADLTPAETWAGFGSTPTLLDVPGAGSDADGLVP